MIFNLFKSKPTLKELIPEGFVDIHSHILPGIDDGPKNIEESFKLISEMKKIKFSKIIATPHIYSGLYENKKNNILKIYKDIVKEMDNSIKIDCAAEYLLDNSVLEKTGSEGILTINKKFILVEFNFISPPRDLHEIIFKLKLKNFIPIIAHPERYLYFKNNFDEIVKLKMAGCKFQLNLLSVVGYYGKEVSKFSDILLSRNIINYVGSDIHNLNHIKQFNKKIKIKNSKNLSNCILNNIAKFSD